MPLFQQSVIQKHLESFDKNHIEARWQLFRGIFHSAEKQQNIRNSKEEQYQEGFLRDLFVTVLGYTINPEVNFNLLTEQKNINNSKKADGAILLAGKAIAVIELKGTETTDLNKIEIQAFGYKTNQPGCNYVITSNFEKLRFYIDNTTQQEEFNLFTLTKPQFELLYACLAWESICMNTPMQILNESVSKENTITKSLYKDYSEFKRALFANLVEMNPQFDKLLLFKKTQKLLDRFLFIFFAEDRLLLPTNLIFRINKEWENIIAQRIQVSLYDRYKMYFNDLNIGAKVPLPAFGKKTGEAITAEFEIFAYNGGLFQPDDLLDNIRIDDTLLHTYTQRMSHYNFESDVDVNILGHIFENSLNEIDEIKSELEGNILEKTKTRRKKDGVFYTPKYITKYIVDNTVGKLCAEKKEEIKLLDEDYITDKKIQTKTRKALLDKLTDYRNWLLDLTICDPACGSGAFLNQALEFLIAEHRYVDELQAKLLGDSLILSDIEKSILERNIYGVDLNDESVEIAKLSLWLRTAQKGRKLNSLNNNIKCGNSLIDDPAVAGDKAFSWEKEFPEVFKEKNKFAYHITTSIHDSRTSQRMIDYHARERRFEGTKPEQEVQYLTKEEEELIASSVSDIVKEDNLNIAAFNLCKDHMHILLVCEEDEVSKIMHKIKGRTARVCNLNKGINNSKETQTNKGINPLDDNRNPLYDNSNPLYDKGNPQTYKGINPQTYKGINPLDDKENPLNETTTKLKDGSTPFWTQKYGCKPITSDQQFWNTVNYIDDNRAKHNLPNNPKLKSTIAGFLKTFEDCFKPEYKGGFDVVIGNPPYVRMQNIDLQSRDYFSNNYKTAFQNYDLYVLFTEKIPQLINPNGRAGYIMPKKFITTEYGEPLKKFIYDEDLLEGFVDFSDVQIFEDATTYTGMFFFKKTKRGLFDYKKILEAPQKSLFDNPYVQIKYSNLETKNWIFLNQTEYNLFERLSGNKKLKETDCTMFVGLQTSADPVFIIERRGDSFYSNFTKKEYAFKNNEILKPVLKGSEIKRYSTPIVSYYLIFPYQIHDNKTNLISSEIMSTDFKDIWEYLLECQDKLKGRENGKMDTPLWYGYVYLKNMTEFDKPKIITQVLCKSPSLTLDADKKYYFVGGGTAGGYGIKLGEQIDQYLLISILNSKLTHWYIKQFASPFQGGYFAYNKGTLGEVPLPENTSENNNIKNLVSIVMSLNDSLFSSRNKFIQYFKVNTQITLTSKLEKWHELEFIDFIKELNKAIKGVKGTPLTKKDEFEWMDLFEENKKKALELKAEIDKTDKEIDGMVYALYGLSEEEIRIVENT